MRSFIIPITSAAAVVASCLLLIAGCQPPQLSAAGKQNLVQYMRQVNARVEPGMAGTLTNQYAAVESEKKDPIWVFVSEDACDELQRLSDVRDIQGVNRMLLTGKAFTVAPGTQVRILAHNSDKYRVRVQVLSGREAQSTGWVLVGMVQL